MGFALAPGQAHKLPLAPSLLEVLPAVPGWIVGNRGYASDGFRQRIWNLGARPAIRYSVAKTPNRASCLSANFPILRP